MRLLSKILLVALFLLLVRLSLYTVDAAEYGYVTILGKHVATFDGGADGAGLHLGWPWPFSSVQRLDRRLQFFDLPATEVLTHDPEGKTIDKTLSIEAYVCWKIAGSDAVDQFVRRLGTPERARDILGPRINSQLGAAITQRSMHDLVSTDAGEKPGRTHVDEKMQELQFELMTQLRETLLRDYGVDLVDIRLRRFSHPGEVRSAIFDRIRSERKKKVTEILSEGELKARNIESAAEEKVRELLARARFDEEKLKGQADTEAMLIRNQAHQKDPEFYAFLKQMEKLQSILADNKTVLLLSTHRPLFDLLFMPPRPLTSNPSLPKDDKKNGQGGMP
ncbi:MAG: protease modulator HflC [Gemmataceae bacterium]|nr:protease modulator HflC [Gemmataceae bacterium]